MEYASLACPTKRLPAELVGRPHVWVLVDFRERSWMECLLALCLPDHVVRIEHAPLLIGDAEVHVGDGSSQRSTWVWERKTLADLEASIKDGRWSEQKKRMLSVLPASSVHYLIEVKGGSADGLLAPDVDPSLLSAVQHASLRDRVHVHFGTGTAQFQAWVQRLSAHPAEWSRAQLVRSDDEAQRRHADTLIATSAKIQLKKADNLTPDLCYLQQLAQVPGISVRLARTVQSKYPTMRALYRALEMEEGGDKKRARLFTSLDGIGAKKAAHLVTYLGFAATDNL
jgi:ERCC4-type nuclease